MKKKWAKIILEDGVRKIELEVMDSGSICLSKGDAVIVVFPTDWPHISKAVYDLIAEHKNHEDE